MQSRVMGFAQRPNSRHLMVAGLEPVSFWSLVKVNCFTFLFVMYSHNVSFINNKPIYLCVKSVCIGVVMYANVIVCMNCVCRVCFNKCCDVCRLMLSCVLNVCRHCAVCRWDLLCVCTVRVFMCCILCCAVCYCVYWLYV